MQGQEEVTATKEKYAMRKTKQKIWIRSLGRIVEGVITKETATHYVVHATLVPGKKPFRWDLHKGSSQIYHVQTEEIVI